MFIHPQPLPPLQMRMLSFPRKENNYNKILKPVDTTRNSSSIEESELESFEKKGELKNIFFIERT